MQEDVKNGLSEETIKKIQKIYKEKEQKKNKGEDYNIFRAIGSEHKETTMTEILADFLNPDGFHHQKRIFLNLFMEKVLKIACPEKIEKVTVHSQYPTQCEECPGKFIDIVIKIGDEKIIPIEAKIYAPVGIRQLENYYTEALFFQKDKNVKPDVYYLTLCGQKPDKRGLGEKTEKAKDHIKCISWKEHIASWLEECQKYCEQNDVRAIPEIMRQFREDINRWIGKKTEMEELDKIFCNEARRNDALEIWRTWNDNSEETSSPWESMVREYVEEKRSHVRQAFLDKVDVAMKKLGAEIDNHAETYSRYLFRIKKTNYFIVIYLEPYWIKTKITVSVFEERNKQLLYVEPDKYPNDLLKQQLPEIPDLKFGEYILQDHVFDIDEYVEECKKSLNGVYNKILNTISSSVAATTGGTK